MGLLFLYRRVIDSTSKQFVQTADYSVQYTYYCVCVCWDQFD